MSSRAPVVLEVWDPRAGYSHEMVFRRWFRKRRILRAGDFGWLVLMRRGALGQESFLPGAVLELLLRRICEAYGFHDFTLLVCGGTKRQVMRRPPPSGWCWVKRGGQLALYCVSEAAISECSRFFDERSCHGQVWHFFLGTDRVDVDAAIRAQNVGIDLFTAPPLSWRVLLLVDTEMGIVLSWLPVGRECDGLLARLSSEDLVRLCIPRSSGKETLWGQSALA